MTFKRILATAIVSLGLGLATALGATLIGMLVSAFIADWPISLYAVLATPAIIALIILAVRVFFWAWENMRKP